MALLIRTKDSLSPDTANILFLQYRHGLLESLTGKVEIGKLMVVQLKAIRGSTIPYRRLSAKQRYMIWWADLVMEMYTTCSFHTTQHRARIGSGMGLSYSAHPH